MAPSPAGKYELIALTLDIEQRAGQNFGLKIAEQRHAELGRGDPEGVVALDRDLIGPPGVVDRGYPEGIQGVVPADPAGLPEGVPQTSPFDPVGPMRAWRRAAIKVFHTL